MTRQSAFHALLVHIVAALPLTVGLALAQTGTTPVDSDPLPNPTSTSHRSGPKDFLARTITLNGSVRARWESPLGSDFALTPADSYLLTRARLDLAFRPASWLAFVGEAQDSRALFYKVPPPASVANPLDFRLAYVEVGNLERSGVRVRAGRQGVTLGSGRLIASLEWSNTARTFDVVSGSVSTKAVTLNLVAGSLVLVDPTRVDRHKPGEHLYASYASFGHVLPAVSIEPYLIAKTQMNVKGQDGHIGNADTLAAGARVIGRLAGAIEYSFEAIREFGEYADDRITAFGLVAGAGWNISSSGWKPRVSGDWAHASGDSGVKDGQHRSFDYMYGFNQPLNSLTGQFGWRNLSDLRVGMDFRPAKALKVVIDYRDFSLANTHDGLYSSSGTRTVFNPHAKSTHVGEGVDSHLVLTLSKATTFGIGVGTLFPGAYLHESGKTTGFVYPFLYLTRKF